MKTFTSIALILLIGFGIYYFANQYALKNQALDGAFYEAPQTQTENENPTSIPSQDGEQNGVQNSANGKLNIDAVCRGALIRMTFTDGVAAEKFVADCKEGKHPEVIEQFKAEMNLGDGAQI